MRRSRERARIWPAPIALGVLSAVGLISALLSDRLGDWIAWIALGIPVVVMVWYMTPRGKRAEQTGKEAEALGLEE